MVIIAYNRAHTGPKSQLGGAHEGFINAEYQIYEVFIIFEDRNYVRVYSRKEYTEDLEI